MPFIAFKDLFCINFFKQAIIEHLLYARYCSELWIDILRKGKGSQSNQFVKYWGLEHTATFSIKYTYMHCDSLGISYVCSAFQLFDQVLLCLFVCFIGWLALGEGGGKEGGGGGRKRERKQQRDL